MSWKRAALVATDTKLVIHCEQHSGRPQGPDAAYSAGFLACADLPHLYTHLEGVGEHFDKLAEVDALVGYVVEYGFVAVALKFDVADFHVQLQLFGDFAGAYHLVLLAGARLFELFKIGGLCLAEHAF